MKREQKKAVKTGLRESSTTVRHTRKRPSAHKTWHVFVSIVQFYIVGQRLASRTGQGRHWLLLFSSSTT